ncbi:MAG: serine/threonine protein kinase [Opitutales bacterium]|nr:serine/threonine protein kinase [Opitutales bacterium]
MENYDFLRKIGSGGYGDVYLAARKSDGARVAVKVIETEVSERERAALEFYGKISDKSDIIKVIDSGETENGIFYAMPLADTLDGCDFPPEDFRWREKSLAKVIEAKLDAPDGSWFTREEILSYIMPIFDAAIEIGESGMLHRDIKPDNILFFGGKPKLSDFGLMGEDRRSLSNVGTPMYIAPSWFVNKGGNPDAYGLATTFYTLATGNLPDSLGRPAYRVPEKIKDTLSDTRREQFYHWNRCLMRAVAENPADRFLTIADFKNALLSEDFDSSREYAGGESPASEAAPKRRRRGAFFYALAAAAVGAAVFEIYQTRRDPAPAPQYSEEIRFRVPEEIFERISEEGFSDKSVPARIKSRAQWLESQKETLDVAKENLAKEKKLAAMTAADIDDAMRKKYAKEFSRWETLEKELNQKGAARREIEASKERCFAPVRDFLDNDIASMKLRVSLAPDRIASEIETIKIFTGFLENPKYYREYVEREYEKYLESKKYLQNEKTP